jgi:hypothetical protein
METFTPRVSPEVAVPDPGKHVNFTHGMVLGVDDFTQEFAYLSGRDQWLARDAIGYGTLSGLKVKIENDEKGPRVLVTPGVALSPRGQLIRVTPAQCAYLDPWLAANKDKLGQSNNVHLYVVLCYRDCATRMIPVPGEPCRSEEELMAPSRLADDFRLELRLTAPDQKEENALRDFVEWLSHVEIKDASVTTLDDFLDSIREAAHLAPEAAARSEVDSPLNSPLDFLYGSPPAGVSIPAAHACEYLRAAFLLWVTELRPLWQPNWFREWQCCDSKTTEPEPAREECVLLAELDVPITDEIKVEDPSRINVNEERRPFLVHLRLLQEWLLCGRVHGSGDGATQSATGVVTFRTSIPDIFAAESNFIDPGLGNGPISVQAAFITAPDEFVFGDIPSPQRVVRAEVRVGGASSTFRIVANASETPFGSEFSVRWFAYRPNIALTETQIVTL